MKDENNIDKEFTDINNESKYKNYIIVVILYFIVIILTIFLILGIKNQKDIVKNNIDDNQKIENSIKEQEKLPDTNNKDQEKIDYDSELGILNQLG